MNDEFFLLEQAYNATRFAAVTPEKVKFVLFPEDLEAYLVDPYKKVDFRSALSNAATGSPVSKWIPVNLVIGEDLVDLYPNLARKIVSERWYIATPNIPPDMTYKALLGMY